MRYGRQRTLSLIERSKQLCIQLEKEVCFHASSKTSYRVARMPYVRREKQLRSRMKERADISDGGREDMLLDEVNTLPKLVVICIERSTEVSTTVRDTNTLPVF